MVAAIPELSCVQRSFISSFNSVRDIAPGVVFFIYDKSQEFSTTLMTLKYQHNTDVCYTYIASPND